MPAGTSREPRGPATVVPDGGAGGPRRRGPVGAVEDEVDLEFSTPVRQVEHSARSEVA